MSRILSVRRLCLVGAMLVSLVAVLRAQQVQVEIAQPPMRLLIADSGQTDMKTEPSAVEPIRAGELLLIADDESASLVVVEAATGKIRQRLDLGKLPAKPKPKWEAMALDDEGAYYLIGAHAVKDPTEPDAREKLKARSRLVRFSLKGGTDGTPLSIDEASLVEWDITEALAVEGYNADPLKNRVKIEGLTVRMLRDPATNTLVRELVIGLREPDEPVRVYTADISPLPATNTRLALKPLFTFNAGRREGIHSQLSSLEYVPAWHGFLILTSTEDASNVFHGNTLWFLPDEKISATNSSTLASGKLQLTNLPLVEPQRVWVFGLDSKAEGLCLLPDNAVNGNTLMRQARFALVYDNDAKTPSLLQSLTLVKWPQ